MKLYYLDKLYKILESEKYWTLNFIQTDDRNFYLFLDQSNPITYYFLDEYEIVSKILNKRPNSHETKLDHAKDFRNMKP